MSLVLSNISKKYEGREVLSNISLECHKGEIVGFVGRNGVGKSTLLKIIAGIITDYDGSIDNHGPVGYLSERNPMYPQMYVAEYLSWLSQLNDENEEGINKLSILVDQLGLQAVGGKKINTLSKGFRQRVGLAAALMGDPEILILDEPINGLDPVQIQDYRNLIKANAANKIIILSSHLMQEIEAICDRVVSLKEGKISDDTYLKNTRKANYQVIQILLDKAIDIDALKALNGIDVISELGNNKLKITGKEGVDIRPILFDFVVDQGCRLLEMRNDTNTVSELFNPSV